MECEVCGQRVVLGAYPDHIGDHIVPRVVDNGGLEAPGTPAAFQYHQVFPSVLLLMWDQGYMEDHDDYEFLTQLGEMIGEVPRGFEEADLDTVMVPITVARTDAETRCAVCQEEMVRETVAVQLLCSHAFCRGCIREWLKLRRTCPVCVVDLETLR